MKQRVVFAVPGALDQRTGGYLFDRRIVDGLVARGRDMRLVELPGEYPKACARAREAARSLIDSLGAGDVLVIDGLASAAFEDCLPLKDPACAAIFFVHHPLSLETGIAAAEARYFADLESRLWRAADGVIGASPHTARAVIAAGASPGAVVVASPGVDLVEPVVRVTRDVVSIQAVRLLCVATLTARKGHRDLIEALAPHRALGWSLDCVGSTDRDPATTEAVRSLIAHFGLEQQIRLHGELPDAALDQLWREADLFVLPSYHEGYGMVLTEAIARGLPVIATRAGAIPETVPPQASRLVDPGDIAELSAVLGELIGDPSSRAQLAEQALTARSGLTDWPRAVDRWIAAMDLLAASKFSNRVAA